MGYRIDLTVIIDGYTNANEVLLLSEESISIDKWLRYYGDFFFIYNDSYDSIWGVDDLFWMQRFERLQGKLYDIRNKKNEVIFFTMQQRF